MRTFCFSRWIYSHRGYSDLSYMPRKWSHERYIKIARLVSFREVVIVPFRMKGVCGYRWPRLSHFAVSENVRASAKVALLQTNCLKITCSLSLCSRRTRTSSIFATVKRSVFQILQSPGAPARISKARGITQRRVLFRVLISRPLKSFATVNKNKETSRKKSEIFTLPVFW